jgi:DNA-binding LacI/PurR family transcriptional regulator
MEPKHQGISRELAQDIAAGKYAANGRLPSEAQLVKRFEVSRPTVARALRDLEADGLIERRAGSGTYVRLGAPERPTARQFGLLVAGRGSTEIFDRISAELASLSRVDGYALFWSGASSARQAEAVTPEQALIAGEQFIERRVAGVFLVPFEHSEEGRRSTRELVERFRQAGIPLVLLDRDFEPFPQRSQFDVVGLDNFAGGFLAAEHLLRLGCQRLTFLTGAPAAPSVEARIAGMHEAQLRAGASTLDSVIFGAPQDAAFVAAAFTPGRFDAVICANDLMAAELLRSLDQARVRVPRDLAVVGFDDVQYATLLRVPLTTVHQPCAQIARVAYRALLERIADPTLPPRTLLLAPQLSIRESCGAYLPRKSKPRRSAPTR